MTGMKDRKDGFENKFAHDEQMSFELEAKCCKIFGLKVAAMFDLGGADAESYAQDVVESNLEESGFDDVIRKVRQDFEEKNMEFDEHKMKRLLDQALAEARQQIS